MTLPLFRDQNDGETVTVENEAGVGFTNKPIVGELELTKTDISDGKVLANVGFRIRNEAGEIVAEGYTDENGIAKFTFATASTPTRNSAVWTAISPTQRHIPSRSRRMEKS